MDFDNFGGMPADEFYLMESLKEEEMCRQEKEEEEQLRMMEE